MEVLKFEDKLKGKISIVRITDYPINKREKCISCQEIKDIVLSGENENGKFNYCKKCLEKDLEREKTLSNKKSLDTIIKKVEEKRQWENFVNKDSSNNDRKFIFNNFGNYPLPLNPTLFFSDAEIVIKEMSLGKSWLQLSERLKKHFYTMPEPLYRDDEDK